MDAIKELLGEELWNQVAEKLGDKKLMIDDGNFIPKRRFDEINDQKKELADQLKDRDKQLEELRKAAEGNADLQKQIDDLKRTNEDTAKEWQAKLEAQAFDFALERKLIEAKAKNVKAVKALLRTDALKLDGENILGLGDQLKALQDSDPYLFGEETLSGKKSGEGNPGTGHKKNPWSKEHFNLTEQGRILRDDPELAKRLQAQAN